MRSSSREDIVEAFDTLDAALNRALDLDFDVLTTPERLNVLHRCEVLRRRLPAVEHPLINELAADAEEPELGGKLPWALADRLHIGRGEARRRVSEAAELGPRRTLTGQPLPPARPATAAAQREGQLNSTHAQIIANFFTYLPDNIDLATATDTETELAELATQYRPDELAKLAQRLADCLHPDGNYSDQERARKRTLVLGPQGRDGMSPIKGSLDPEARATLDAALARLAAPGMCNPADDVPCLSGTPSQQAIDNDTRSAGQRNHDALTALGRAMLASGDLGQHNGLPASIIVSTTLAELKTGAGKAITGGGTWLPMPDLIRLASQAHHWLRIYDGAKELALYHTKRLASPGQRMVLYARDRGCTHPGCPVPAYLTEAHHNDPYSQTGRTDIDDLTLRCGPHHELITTGGWKTRRNSRGHTETLPPPHLDHGQPRINQFHHPENLLRHNQDDDEDDDPPD